MSKLNRRSILAASAAASLFPGALSAQSWPTKPIRWVVPYTAGGLTDVVTRLTLEKMAVGQNFVVDNKPGANSLIGAEMVANAAPDGYTFLTVIAALSYAGRRSSRHGSAARHCRCLMMRTRRQLRFVGGKHEQP